MPRPRRAAWRRLAHAARTRHQVRISELTIVAESGTHDCNIHDNWGNYNGDGHGNRELRNKQQDRHDKDQQPCDRPSNGSQER